MLAGIALGMSMLPEEFPVVLTVFMAMGAWRISRARVLTRRAAAIETLGSATVLCTDKTGTLTENRMSIAELRLEGGEVFRPREATGARMPEDFHDLVEFGMLASAPTRSTRWRRRSTICGREHLAETEHLHGPNGSSCTRTGCARSPRDVARLAKPTMAGKSSSSPPRARPRRSPTCAT